MMFLIEASFGGQRESIWLDDEDSTLACIRVLLRANADVHVSLLTSNPANDPGQETDLSAGSR